MQAVLTMSTSSSCLLCTQEPFIVHELLFLSQLTATSVYTENSSEN